MYTKVTHNYVGTVEMLLGTAWCGIFFVLVGGQPVMINGGTGPVLAFSGVLYKLAQTMDVPFLVFNAWCGLWVCFTCLWPPLPILIGSFGMPHALPMKSLPF